MLIQELTDRLLVTTMVAHQRAGEVSVENAARLCRMPPDNFLRCYSIVDQEARRMLMSLPPKDGEPKKEAPPLAVLPPEDLPPGEAPPPTDPAAFPSLELVEPPEPTPP